MCSNFPKASHKPVMRNVLKIKTLKIAQPEFMVYIRLKHIHFPSFPMSCSLSTCLSAGMTDDIRLHNICLFIAPEAREWHTLVSFDCLMFFFSSKMCLMTAMWACRNAFAALQWNIKPAKSGCETTLRHDSDRNFPSPHYQHQTSWVIAITSAEMLRATCFSLFLSEKWGIMNSPIVNLWGSVCPVNQHSATCCVALMRP